jgi:hypothetical protein
VLLEGSSFLHLPVLKSRINDGFDLDVGVQLASDPFLPCTCRSADCFDCAGAAAFGLHPRLGLHAVNVAEIDLANGDYRRGLECRFA